MTTTTEAKQELQGEGNGAIEKRSPARTIYDLLKANEREIGAALPAAGVTPHQLIRTAMTVVKQNPTLVQCTPSSIAGALMHSAHVGLLPGGTLGHAHLVPYWNRDIKAYEAQFQIGWQGYVALARRSGQIDSIYADVIREGDRYDIKRGLHRDLVHEPNYGGERGAVLFAYAVAEYPGGGKDWVVLDREQIEQRRQMSQTGRQNKGPWKDHYEAMSKKSAIKALAPFLPLSLDDARAFSSDGSVVRWNPEDGGDVVDVDPVEDDSEPAADEPELEAGAAPEADDEQDSDLSGLSQAQYEDLRDGGVGDKERPALTAIATGGRTESTKQLSAHEKRRLLFAATLLHRGDVALVLNQVDSPKLIDAAGETVDADALDAMQATGGGE